jgi:hypothetical protein
MPAFPGAVTSHLKGAARFVFRLVFGILAVFMGTAIILWVCYNALASRRPEYTGTHLLTPLGIGPALIGIGVYWLRPLQRRAVDDPDTP